MARCHEIPTSVQEAGQRDKSLTIAGCRSGRFFYHPDHLGSSTVLTNEAGAVIGRFSYRPFGGFSGPAPSDGAAIHHYFTGQELDASTELYHLGARYYDPALGRFTQPDPLLDGDPQNGPYTYARNNPLRLIDPTGLSFHSNLGSGWGIGGFGGSGVSDFLSQSPLGQAWQNFTNFTTQSFSQTWQSLNSLVTSSMQNFSSTIGQARSFGAETIRDFVTPIGWGLMPLGVASPQFQGNALGTLANPMTQLAITGFARGGAEYYHQAAETLKQFAPGWTGGIASAQFLQGGFQAVNVAAGAAWYHQLYADARLYGYSNDQIWASSMIHGAGQGLKLLGTNLGAGFGGAVGSVIPGVGTTWGAAIGATTIGTAVATYIDARERILLEAIGVIR